MNQKKLLLRLPLLLLAALTLTACPSDEVEEDTLKTSVTQLTLAGGQGQVSISSNTSWNVTALPSWISCSAMSGNGDMLLLLTETEANPSTDDRSGTMSVKCVNSATAVNISITQPGTPHDIKVNPTNVVFDAAQGTYMLAVTANYQWSFTLTYDGDDKDWLTITPAPETPRKARENQVEIKAAANNSVNTRTAELTFACGTATPVKVKVSQAKSGARLEVKKSNINISSEGGEETFTVESNIKWTVESNAEWCRVEIVGPDGQTAHDGNGEVTVKADKNESITARKAVVTVKSEDLTQEVEVTQQAATPMIELSVQSLSFTSKMGDTRTFQITSNTDWTVDISDEGKSWLSVSPMGGGPSSSPMDVNVRTTEENNETKARPAYIFVRAIGVAEVCSVKVEQIGAEPILKVEEPKTYTFSPKGGQHTFTVTSNLTWYTVASDFWLGAKENDKEITVTVGENKEAESKTGTITVIAYGEDKKDVITVTQEGVSLKLSTDSLSFPKNGGEQTFTVECNSDWKVSTLSTSIPWCKWAEKGNTVTLKAEKNPYVKERNATLTVKAGNETRDIKLHQEPQQEPGADDNPLPGGYSRKTK